MQLDLFLHRSSAQVFPFPADRQRHLIVETAQALLRMSKPQGRTYWRKQVATLRRDLHGKGFSSTIIDQQVARYTDAVSRQMYLHIDYRRSPNDAA